MQPHPQQQQSFWRSGGGITLIVALAILGVVILCVGGCLGLGLIGAATPSPTPSF